MKYKRPRGTQDIVPPESDKWRHVESVFVDTLDCFAYRDIRTPIFESTDLFVRAVGEETEIISKEMYTFKDRRDRSLTLRPENTASVIRAYLENGMHRLGGIIRLYYIGPMFRYDRPQAGRYRQFHQVGAEAIGGGQPAVDVEMIQVIMTALQRLGFLDLDLRLNSIGTPASRGPYLELLLKALDDVAGELCDDCGSRYRNNPLRVFDCKTCTSIKERLPKISDHLDADSEAHYGEVKRLLTGTGITFVEDPFLVRGLDYYTRTTFEIYHERFGAQDALCGGGRYDDLVEKCGGPKTPAIGFSAGLERIISALPAVDAENQVGVARIDYYVVALGDGAQERALKVAATLRQFGNTEVDLSGRAVKTQLRSAEKKRARIAVVIDDSTRGSVVWKDMEARTEERVAEADLDRVAAGGREGDEK